MYYYPPHTHMPTHEHEVRIKRLIAAHDCAQSVFDRLWTDPGGDRSIAQVLTFSPPVT